MTVRKRSKVWWYDFGNHKYPGPIPEARTKHEAEQAEIKLKRDVFEGKYGRQFGTMSFAAFVGDPDANENQFGEGTFLEWAKNNKRSWKHDRFRVRVLLEAFRGRTLGEISPLAIETFKNRRRQAFTKRKNQRSPASVNLGLQLLSRIFSLAIRLGLAESNPCSRVSKFKLQNQRHRYLLPDEEPLLLAQCTGKRKHLATMIPLAIGTGARKSEQLNLKVRQVDFFRNLIVFDKTKSGRSRMVDMNSDIRQILLELCRGKQPDDYVWSNPTTGGPYTDIKHAFPSACADAKIEGLVWHDLRATYGTRLGEAGFNAYDIAKLMGHANISTSQRYVRNLPVGAGDAVMLKNQRRHKTVTNDDSGALALVVKC
ncbi:MAG TPA: site-specific integrase [Candidatus Binatia bacterium]